MWSQPFLGGFRNRFLDGFRNRFLEDFEIEKNRKLPCLFRSSQEKSGFKSEFSGSV